MKIDYKNIIVVNEEKLEEVKNNFKKEGPESICVFSDFDRTLTYGTFKGKRVPSMIGVLREKNEYLGEDYVEKASFLAKKYRPIEFNPNMDEREKKKAMESWWHEHIELLIEKGLNKKHFQRVVDERVVGFRDSVKDIFENLKKQNIPLVIISASGLGEEPIEMMIKKELGDFSNVYIISNSFLYNERGDVVGYKEPIIHIMNKNDVLMEDKPFYNKIKNRKNIILLGDSFDDVKMAENINYNNLLKICFLDEYAKEMIEDYKKLYDVLILNDSSATFVEKLLTDIVE
jgi:HAD superfamily hydrolase (TIGR01544 family)